MNPPIIAIEGVDASGVNAQVNKLEASLLKEGLRVGVFKFPQYSKTSSFFIKELQSGRYGSNVNPYAASTFYALDRFDVQNEIEQSQSTKDVVIVCNYIGATLAQQGARFNTEQQKPFYLWLDGFETQFFGNIRPNHSFVVAFKDDSGKVLESYKALCDYFPKDYSLINLKSASDNSLIESIKSSVVSKILPKEKPELPTKKLKHSTCSVLDLLRSNTDVLDIKITKEYIDIPELNKNQQQIYREGVEELSRLRNKILKDTPTDKKNYVSEFLSILSSIVSHSGDKVKKTTTSQGEFENILHDSVKLSYSSGIKTGAEITEIMPRNQMTIVNDILFAVTDLSQSQIIEQANKITYEKKSELIRSYIKDNHGTGFNNVVYTFNIGATLHDILWIKRYLQQETITIQEPSPRNGYDVPSWANNQSRLYEQFFDTLIDINSTLSNTQAARYLVALGNVASAKVKLSYHDVKKLKSAKNAPQIAHDIVMAAAVTHPILYE